ncbi:MAG: hypothetical protein O9289_19450 [Rhodobacteraceae bacterium]|jgi:hypothetical protein|nr:hypothetical protein [Paracoccaceae bacterium]MCZ8085382.1 hypothetical protein [Paracoccaceae bacterium]
MIKAPGNDEDTVNIPADGIRQSVPWKLRSDDLEEELIVQELSALMDRGGHDRDQRGKLIEREAFSAEEIEGLHDRVAARLAKLDQVDALNVEQIIRLAEVFAFPVEAVVALSKDLARALNKTITPVFAPLPRNKAIARAQTEMQRTAKDIMTASEALLRGFERLERLDTTQASDRIGAARFKALLKDYDQVLRDVETLHRKLRFLSDTPDVALDLRPENKRVISDLRRTAVLSSLFAFWKREGRTLSITTDPIDNRRKGQLIEFVNAAVRCMTDPSSDLSGDVIHDELTKHKRASLGT